MQFSIATIALFLSSALAAPYTGSISDPYDPCTGLLQKSPQCCNTDILGLANLDCHGPPSVPTSPSQFQASCVADGGRQARCCTLSLGLAVVCADPVGL
uniref:Cerato-ulmin n=1 Tax=Ophiostoma himal-ulmi TaxID=61193 RepID=P79090_9PEZI|nr:cerato-ulmin [Ophiostoma himal-ulmi]CAB02151.1 cerato-ulmin [Ophiostoma himal-ulmi]